VRIRTNRIRGWQLFALLMVLGIVSSARASLLRERESITHSVDPVASSRKIYTFTPGAYPATGWTEKRLDEIRLKSATARLATPSPEALFLFFQTSEPLPEYELQFLVENGRLLIDFKKPGIILEVAADEVLASLLDDDELSRAISALGLGSGKLQNLEGIVPAVATLAANVLLLMQARALELAMLLRRLLRLDKKKDKGQGNPYGGSDGVELLGGKIEPYMPIDQEKGGKTSAGARRMLRSVFKVLVGCFLGLLIWGFVRNL